MTMVTRPGPWRAGLLALTLGAAVPLPAAAAAAADGGDGYACLIEANQTVELRSAVEGVIEKVLVRRGDRVRAGQPLVVLESTAELAAVEVARYRSQMDGRVQTARNRLDYAQKKLERQRDLHAQNYVAAQARDEAEAEKRVAESELREAMESQALAQREYKQSNDQLARRTLRSPFDGVVVERLLNPGDLAEYGAGRKPILKLAQVEPLRVEVVLPVAAWNQLKTGAIGWVTPESVGGRHEARVTVVDSVFDAASGTFGARLELANTRGAVPAGIRCRVDFPTLPARPGGRGTPPKPAAG